MADADPLRTWMINTVDVDGHPIRLFVGQVKHNYRIETVIRIDGGPVVLLPLNEVGQYLKALRETAADTHKRNLQSEP